MSVRPERTEATPAGSAAALAQLLLRARSDRAAFGEFVECTEKPLARMIRKRVDSDHAAQDIVQDTYLKALRNLPQFDPSQCGDDGPWPWLATIAVRLVIDWQRRRRGTVCVDFTAAEEEPSGCMLGEPVDYREPEPSRRAELAELKDDVNEALAELRGEEEQMLRLKYHEGLSYAEIAEACATTIGRVTMGLHHTKHAKLQPRLHKHVREDQG